MDPGGGNFGLTANANPRRDAWFVLPVLVAVLLDASAAVWAQPAWWWKGPVEPYADGVGWAQLLASGRWIFLGAFLLYGGVLGGLIVWLTGTGQKVLGMFVLLVHICGVAKWCLAVMPTDDAWRMLSLALLAQSLAFAAYWRRHQMEIDAWASARAHDAPPRARTLAGRRKRWAVQRRRQREMNDAQYLEERMDHWSEVAKRAREECTKRLHELAEAKQVQMDRAYARANEAEKKAGRLEVKVTDLEADKSEQRTRIMDLEVEIHGWKDYVHALKSQTESESVES